MFIGFGDPAEWRAFQEAHSVFVERVPSLFRTFQTIFRRKIDKSAPNADRIVFHLGMLGLEDFKEILLLCANGHGVGGQKILRGLYEKTVTADYISTHPGEADKFLDYFWIHMKKDINHQKNVYKNHVLSPGEEHIIEEYEKVKDLFIEPLCKKCGTSRPQMSWTKLDVASMAKAAKSPIADWYYSWYFLPTLQTHTTMGAIFTRLRVVEELDFTYFSSGPQREVARKMVRDSHLIMLNVLHRQNEHFQLAMDDELMERAKDFDDSWIPDQPIEEDSVSTSPDT